MKRKGKLMTEWLRWFSWDLW